ncbi:MAG TPA: hypothetical protein VKI40_06750 [Terriglobales bacterium]|nr:hypothetical protein [Terriglobales bacterium]
MILKSETYNFHRLDLTRQAGFIVTIYDEDGLRLAATMSFSTPAEAFAEARKIVDNKETGLASEIETMEIVSLGLEDHGSCSHAALKSIIASSRVAA